MWTDSSNMNTYVNIDIVENNEHGFKIYRKQADSSWDGTLASYTHIGTVGSDVVTYTDDDDLTGRYSYVVTSYNGGGNALPWAETSILVVGPPDPPVVEAMAGHEQVVLTWEAPTSNGGSPLAQYAYRYQQAGADGWERDWTDVGLNTSQLVERLVNEQPYVFEVWVQNQAGYYSKASSVGATPRHPIRGPASVEYQENSEAVVATYHIRGHYTWSVAGRDDFIDTDDDYFEMDTSGQLHFKEPPNYEMPQDTPEEGADLGDNIYHVRIRATPGSGGGVAASASSSFSALASAFWGESVSSVSLGSSGANPALEPPPSFSKAVVVAVVNVDEAGVVSLPEGPPRVGEELTARLEDDDGVLPGTAQWTWSGQASEPGSDHEGASESSYEPTGADVGRRLQVRVDYEDVWGPQTVTSDPTEAVQPAGAVSLTPSEPRVGQPVTARLSGPEEAVTGAAWSWWRREQDPDDWLLLGSSVSSSSKVASSAFADMFGSFKWGSTEVSSYQPTVADTGWVLQARVSWDGQEVSSDPSAPVRAGVPDRPRALEGEGADGTDGSGAVVLSWQTPFANGSPITGYEVQYRLFGTTDWNPAWTPIDGSTQATTSHTVDSLALGEMHTFEVRAINAEGTGPPARTTAQAEWGEHPAGDPLRSAVSGADLGKHRGRGVHLPRRRRGRGHGELAVDRRGCGAVLVSQPALDLASAPRL